MPLSGFVVLVDFRLKPGVRPTFRTLVDANARASVVNEAACRRFDVIEPHDELDCVLLYEVYDDRAAFDLHLASDHYRDFAAASDALCTGKTVKTGTLVFQGGT